jgi:NAD(P)-dependent dehydrogenase (short-subunit alcohol dehydrogenase family)
MDLGLQDQAAVVTGASRGIGLAVARRLSSEGARVLLVARSTELLDQAAQSCGPGARTLTVDVTVPDAPELIAAAAAAELGQVDVLVNNAGTNYERPLDDLVAADFQAQFEVHVLAPLRLIQTFAPDMAERGYGRIVNVVSISGRRPTAINPAYSVAKAAELMLTRAFADRYAADGVCVNAVNPGPVDTEMWLESGGMADQVAQRRGTTAEDVMAATGAATPRGRFGSANEIAAVVVFLCSRLAANVVGAGWQTDGGAVPSI